MTITFEIAKKLALAHLNMQPTQSEDRVVLIEDRTITKPYGWIFFYDSERFLNTEDISYALAGNAPIVVLKDGSMRYVNTGAQPIQMSIDALDSELLKR